MKKSNVCVIALLTIVFALVGCTDSVSLLDTATSAVEWTSRENKEADVCVGKFTDWCTTHDCDTSRLRVVCNALVKNEPITGLPILAGGTERGWFEIMEAERILHHTRGFVSALLPDELASLDSKLANERGEWDSEGSNASGNTRSFLLNWKSVAWRAIELQFQSERSSIEQGGNLSGQRFWALEGLSNLLPDKSLTANVFEALLFQLARRAAIKGGVWRDLKVIPMNKVRPHEEIDPARVAQLVAHLETQDMFENPVIVAHDKANDGYIVMDGATRTGAMRALNSPHILGQVVSVDKGFVLGTWHHVTPAISEVALKAALGNVSSIVLEPISEIPRNKAGESRLELDLGEAWSDKPGGPLAYLEFHPDGPRDPSVGHLFVVKARRSSLRMDALRDFVEAYTEAVAAWGEEHGETVKVERTDAESFLIAHKSYPNATTLVLHKALKMHELYDAVNLGKLVPAGITRSLLSSQPTEGRILNASVKMDWLTSRAQTAYYRSSELHHAMGFKTRGVRQFPGGYTVCEANGPRLYHEAIRVLQPFERQIFSAYEISQGAVCPQSP